jgi:hypothetical protein
VDNKAGSPAQPACSKLNEDLLQKNKARNQSVASMLKNLERRFAELDAWVFPL